jgi:signal transduction histidine kinase/CheY-like chemotaxis protein
MQTIESDMTVVSQIAVKLVASNLRLLKTEADMVAAAILAASVSDAGGSEETARLPGVLQDQMRIHHYLSLAIINSRGLVASTGVCIPGEDFIRSSLVRRAAIGERVISSTELTWEGRLVIRICVPMGSRVLVATLPGTILSDMIDEFRIWASGNIFMLDGTGVVIANFRPHLVQKRYNYIEMGQTDPTVRAMGEFYRLMIRGNVGTGIYQYEGASRICAYTPVGGSDGWTLGAAAPIDESPITQIQSILLLSAGIFLGLGILTALFAANIIAKPFKKIEEQNHKLEELKVTAENASQAKSDFLSNMSHEMRTPMNAVIGMTAIAKSSSDIERKNYCLNKIEEASTHLLGVINDILDMSKIEANKFELSSTHFIFEKMLQKVANVINFRVDEKKQNFTVHIDKDIPRMFNGDDQRLAQVIANLLSNAVKFTPEQGAIHLDTKLLGEEDGLCSIQIDVTDSGIGISEEQRARLFTSFSQADSGIARRFGGTGLGLAISKRIMEMMGGRIWVESEPGKGSTFSVIAKLERVEGDQQGGRLEPGRNWKNIRILMVDDDPLIREYFSEIAEQYDLAYDTAADGEKACALIAEKGPYNIYFVDWKMPGMNGIELSRRIKETGAGREQKSQPDKSVVIMISAAEWSDIEDDAKQAGVSKFLPKPFFPSSMVDYINECIGTEQYTPKDRAADINGCFEGRRILLVEDIQINQEILQALLEPTAVYMECANDGIEALEKFNAAPEKYDMIFMDVQMPEMDGYEATRRIRALDNPAAKTIPIVAMTANVFREDIEKCLASGMNDHVGKPLDFEEVISKLYQYLPANDAAVHEEALQIAGS